MVTSSAPLLNEYKERFFWKRLPQTISGGLRLKLGCPSPFYVHALQILLFLLPAIVGGFCSCLVDFADVSLTVGASVCGMVLGFIVLSLHLFVWWRREKSSPVERFNSSVLDEDDQIEFTSCCGIETLEFIVVPKKYDINVFIHSVICGGLGAGALTYLLPSRLSDLFTTGPVIVVVLFGWLTVCIAHNSLAFSAPPEPATFTAQDTFEFAVLTRPFYVAVLFSFDFAARYHDELLQTNKWLYVVFCCLPLLWTLAILPPLDSFLPWAAEKLLVYGLGGSPMASDLRLLFVCVASGVVLIITTFLPSRTVAVVVSACFGYALSLDMVSLVQLFVGLCSLHSRYQKVGCSSMPSCKSSAENHFLPYWTSKTAMCHVLCLVGIGVMSGLLHSNRCSISDDVPDILTYVVIGCMALVVVCGDLQRVYIGLDIVKNPLYAMAGDSGTRKILQGLAVVRRFVLNLVLPFFMLAVLSVLLDGCNKDKACFVFALGSVRSLRWIWQNTLSAAFDLTVSQIITWSISPTSSFGEWWEGLGLGIQLVLIAIIHNWFIDFLSKIRFIATVAVTSWTNKKQHHYFTPFLLIFIVVFFPVILAITAVSSVIASPILPLFGLPLFLLAFPRPQRFWPGNTGSSYSPCSDTVYYQQLCPQLQQSLRRLFASGSLGEPHPGSHYLFRFQDRLAWICVLERGFGYATVYMKGLELQETSCHTVEAALVDEIFESSFDCGSDLCGLNWHVMNTLHAKDRVPVQAYSDARNVLTGIIDHPDNLKRFPAFFVKSLIWVLIHHLAERGNVPYTTSKHHQDQHHPDFSTWKDNEKTTSQTIEVHSQFRDNEVRKKVSIFTVETIFTRSSESPVPPKDSTSHDSNIESIFTVGSSFRMPSHGSSIQDRTVNNSKLNFLTSSVSHISGFPQADQPLWDDDECSEEQELSTAFCLPGVIESPTKPTIQSVPLLPFPGQRKKRSTVSNPSGNGNGAQTVLDQTTQFPLPQHWLEIPVDDMVLIELMTAFPYEWLKHVQNVVGGEHSEMSIINQSHVKFILACCAVAHGTTSSGSVTAFSHPESRQLYQGYRGEFPWTPQLNWLIQDSNLSSLVKSAYRYAVKLMYDSAILGDIDSIDELQVSLEEYGRDWYIGLEDDDLWTNAVISEKPQLFSLGFNKTDGTYTSRVLSFQTIPMNVGKLNSEAVHGQWASLALELLYFTNDDEERYSIQAHPTLLRNITIQAADLPLGYPIYASGPISVPTW